MLIEELYKKHEKELNRFARSLARNEKEAEDLLQETFVRSLGNTEKLESLLDYQQRAWLFKVLRNLYYDKKRRGLFETPLEDGDEPVVQFSDHEIEVRELLDTLSPKQYDMVYQRFWLGMNSKQIANHLQIPDSTVRYRLQQSLKQLRTHMNNQY